MLVKGPLEEGIRKCFDVGLQSHLVCVSRSDVTVCKPKTSVSRTSEAEIKLKMQCDFFFQISL